MNKFKVGDRVTVKSGAYVRYTGTVVKRRNDNWCLVKLDDSDGFMLSCSTSLLSLTASTETESSTKDNLKDLIVKEYADKQVWCIIDSSGSLEADGLELDQAKKIIVDEYNETYHIEIMIPMFSLKAETSYTFNY